MEFVIWEVLLTYARGVGHDEEHNITLLLSC